MRAHAMWQLSHSRTGKEDAPTTRMRSAMHKHACQRMFTDAESRSFAKAKAHKQQLSMFRDAIL